MHEIIEISERIVKLSEESAEHRSLAAKNKLKFDIVLASKITGFQQIRKAVGYETATLMLLAEKDSEVTEFYSQYVYHESQYKGKEQILLALRDKLYAEKDLMKLGAG